jgi:hypothetical protein
VATSVKEAEAWIDAINQAKNGVRAPEKTEEVRKIFDLEIDCMKLYWRCQ